MAGKQLKSLREKLGLSQQELAGPEITRNLISMIENEKTPLTPRTAELLTRQINDRFKGRQSFVQLTAEDLTDPARYQARQEIHALLDTIAEYRREPHFTLGTYLSRLAGVFSQWDLPTEKTDAYSLAASCFEETGRNQEAHLYYSRAYENAARTEDCSRLAQVTLCLTRTALKLGHTYSAILAADALRSYEGRIDDRLLLEVFLDQAAAYMTEADYDNALGSLIFSEHLIPEDAPHWSARVLTLKLDCYISKGMYGIASRIFSALEPLLADLEGAHRESLRITLTCLQGRMSPGGLDPLLLQELWQRFAQAPSALPRYETLFLQLMEAAASALDLDLFQEISWRALTDIPPQMHPMLSRSCLTLMLRVWRSSPKAGFAPHWRYMLRSEPLRAIPGYGDLVLGYLAFMDEAGLQDLMRECLSLQRSNA